MNTLSMNLLSIVLTGRNDNYCGDFLRRMQCCIDSIIHGSERSALPTELLIVEWNPPTENPPLSDALILPANEENTFCSVRIISVPHEIHSLFNTKIPLIEYTAKNVGMRRARGNYILVTNPDNFFTSSFFTDLRDQTLSPTAFYRADRLDISAQELTFYVTGDKDAQISSSTVLHHSSCAALKDVLDKHEKSEENKKSLHLSFTSLADLYTDSSGDFLLAHRAAWRNVGGYKETTDFFTHIDSICCLQFVALGLEQRWLPKPIYHFDHARNIERLKADKAWGEYTRLRDRLSAGEDILPVNAPDWGLGSESLPEKWLLLPDRHPARSERQADEESRASTYEAWLMDMLRSGRFGPRLTKLCGELDAIKSELAQACQLAEDYRLQRDALLFSRWRKIGRKLGIVPTMPFEKEGSA
jgi:hypothetical protein